MNRQHQTDDFALTPRRLISFSRNVAIMVAAALLHFVLQLWLGSHIAGEPISNIPGTTKASLVLLVLIFLGVQISSFFLINNFDQNLRERSIFVFLLILSAALAAILIFRVPYSSVFLFWGILLLFILWNITLSVLQRFNRPIIGLPKNTIPDFKDYIDPEFIRIISPDMPKRVKIDLIVLKEQELASPEWAGFLMKCFMRSITVEEHNNLMEKLSGRIELTNFSFRNSLQLVRENKYLLIKRVIDVVLSAWLLLILSPLMLFFGFLVSIESAGSPIFSQRRVGIGGRPFVIYKFRSMRKGKDDPKAKFAVRHDRRVTPLGKFLRRSRIDELPQLWNVFIGDMSLIGPRPEQVDLINSIQEEIPLFSLRHALRPGITGWAQVCQGYADNISSTRTKLSYDLWYVSNVSLLLDFSIGIKTIKVIITGFGSR